MINTGSWGKRSSNFFLIHSIIWQNLRYMWSNWFWNGDSIFIRWLMIRGKKRKESNTITMMIITFWKYCRIWGSWGFPSCLISMILPPKMIHFCWNASSHLKKDKKKPYRIKCSSRYSCLSPNILPKLCPNCKYFLKSISIIFGAEKFLIWMFSRKMQEFLRKNILEMHPPNSPFPI